MAFSTAILRELAPLIRLGSEKGMLFSTAQLRDFLALVRTHYSVVLAGDVGYAGEDQSDSCCGQIARWTMHGNPGQAQLDISGRFAGLLQCGRTRLPAHAVSSRASGGGSRTEVPHFICLDEMNIAQVEHYFADFLGLLEIAAKAPTSRSTRRTKSGIPFWKITIS